MPTSFTGFSRSGLGCLVLAISLGLASPILGQAPDSAFEPSGDTVVLAFGWTPGLHGEVQVTRVRIEASALTGADTSALRTTHSLGVSEIDDGLLVQVSDFRAPGAPEDDGAVQGIALLSSFSPDYVLGTNGDLLRVEGIDDLMATMRAMYDSMFTEMESPAMEGLLSGLISEEAILGQVSQEWNALIGAWVGAELEVGSLYELETEQPLPLPGNPIVPFRYELGVIGRVTCDEADDAPSCVELVMRSYPDPEFMRGFLEDFGDAIRSDLPGVPQMVFNDFSIFSETVVVTSPETLVPRTLLITQRVDGSVTAQGMEETTSQYRETYYEYSLTSGN